MMTSKSSVGKHLWLPTLAAAGMIVATSTDQAQAGHRHRRVSVNVGRVWVPPVYQTRARTIVSPAVFETQARQMWHEPVYETRRMLVDEPAKYAERRIPRYTPSGRLDGYETVRELVRSERQVWRNQPFVIREGYYETVYDRVLVRPETTRVVYDKVVVRRGHWKSGRHYTRPHRHRGHRPVRTVAFGGHRPHPRGFGISFELGR
jgi:hypothetical protein